MRDGEMGFPTTHMAIEVASEFLRRNMTLFSGFIMVSSTTQLVKETGAVI